MIYDYKTEVTLAGIAIVGFIAFCLHLKSLII